MKTLLKNTVAATTALFIGSSAASALALAPGDVVSMAYMNDGSTISTFSGTVGAGTDISPFRGALSVDMNAGPNGDGFTITSNGNYCGITCASSVETIVFSGLDFGAPGFVIDSFLDNTGAGTSGGSAAVVDILSPSSFSITFTDPAGAIAMFRTGQVTFSGTFADAPVSAEPIAPIPLPSPAPLAALGIGALAILRRRDRS